MNKGGKLVLLLWFLWVVISWFALLFLFSDANKQVTPNTQNSTWMTTETQTTDDHILSLDSLSSWDSELVILLPAYFYNDWFKTLSRDLLLKENIKISYKTLPNLASYKQFLLSWWTEQDIDIFLLPLDWITWFPAKKRSLWEVMSPYFHALFTPWLLDEVTSVMPYAIDPMVTFIHTTTPPSTISMESFFSYSMLWKKRNTLSIPLLLWAGKNDVKLLELWRESFEHYTEIIYQLLKQFVLWKDKTALTYFLELSPKNVSYAYDYAHFKQAYQTIEKRNPSCKIVPSACIFAYNLADIRLGFLSDQGLFPLYFSWSSLDSSSIQLAWFPLSTPSYPVRGRWFVISSWATHSYASLVFLQHYLLQTMDWWTWLRATTLSASPTIMQEQLIAPNYQQLASSSSWFTFIQWSLTSLQDFFATTKTLEMLLWTYNSFSYLSAVERDW